MTMLRISIALSFLAVLSEGFVVKTPASLLLNNNGVRTSACPSPSLLMASNKNEKHDGAENTNSNNASDTLAKAEKKDSSSFLKSYFLNTPSPSDCDDLNTPPSLRIVLRSLQELPSGSDIRGRFVSHPKSGSMLNVAHAIGHADGGDGVPPLTPFAAQCFGHAFALKIKKQKEQMKRIEEQRIRSARRGDDDDSCDDDDDMDPSKTFGDKVGQRKSLNIIRNSRAGDDDDSCDDDDDMDPSKTFGDKVGQRKSLQMNDDDDDMDDDDEDAERRKGVSDIIILCLGRDPREHGVPLSDAFARGAESVEGVQVVYTGVATTPSLYSFCRQNLCDGAVMVTASHLPADRNGFKFFSAETGGFSKADVQDLVVTAGQHARTWFDAGVVPPTSGKDGVFCSKWVDYMPKYEATLTKAILLETDAASKNDDKPLKGLKIVLNAGNGSGGFFGPILADLGADVSASIHLEPDSAFPAGVPNPEYKPMMDATLQRCQETHADIGIMLDTDADRCGFIVPRVVNQDDGTRDQYEPLNRNRLIALLGTIFASTSENCTFVTDSVTSEGLETFLTSLGIDHVRFLKGYANVIGKARELTESGTANAEVAIETSGHCAMRENGYLDDGTYTAVKVVSLMANTRKDSGSLLDLIADMPEMPIIEELRMDAGSLATTKSVFDLAVVTIEQAILADTQTGWSLDTDNLEGIRVRTGNGGFFMLRKSLHDPIVSMQVEGVSKEEIRDTVVRPLFEMFATEDAIRSHLELRVLEEY